METQESPSPASTQPPTNPADRDTGTGGSVPNSPMASSASPPDAKGGIPDSLMPTSPDSSSGARKLLMLVVLLLIIILAVVSYLAIKKTPTVRNIPPTSNTVVLAPAAVSITHTGFVPATITVKVNQAVVWTNMDSVAHEVASDPYPTDTTVPSFNDRQPLEKNDSYDYVFNKTGTYTYHDTLNPYSFKGTVVVKK